MMGRGGGGGGGGGGHNALFISEIDSNHICQLATKWTILSCQLTEVGFQNLKHKCMAFSAELGLKATVKKHAAALFDKVRSPVGHYSKKNWRIFSHIGACLVPILACGYSSLPSGGLKSQPPDGRRLYHIQILVHIPLASLCEQAVD